MLKFGAMQISKIFLALAILLLAPVTLGAGNVASVATLEDYAPYCFPKDNSVRQPKEIIPPGSDSSRLQGYSWDILRASLHEAGYTIELFIAPWARAFAMAKSGKVDVLFPTGLNKERTKFFYYSREPINRADFLVYVRRDSQIRWKGLHSLNGLTIGIMRGWNYGDRWKANTAIEKHEVNTILQGFLLLDEGRLDGFAGYEVNFDSALKRARWKQIYKKLPAFDFSAEYLAGSQSGANIIAILDDFDAGKRKIIKSGIFDQIVEKWQQ